MKTTADLMLSVITPAYHERDSLKPLYDRLCAVFDAQGIDWEWIVVDDHSADGTSDVVRRLAESDGRVRGMRLARNSGSHTAIMCGLDQCRGDCAVVLAADLQDPPEAIVQLLEAWRRGFQVVWAVRERREGEQLSTVAFSRCYYWIMRNLAGLREMPATGADFFLADKRVVQALRGFRESNVSLFALLSWMGFRQTCVGYTKAARAHGASGWTLGKKLKLIVDSITSFTYLPIRVMSCAGFVTFIFGLIYATVVIVNAFVGKPATGWSSLMVVVVLLGGAHMLMMGILGEYLWRALDEARRRPRYLIEEAVGHNAQGGPTPEGGEATTTATGEEQGK